MRTLYCATRTWTAYIRFLTQVDLRYYKAAANVVQFKAFQLGLCFFAYDPNTDSLHCQPFNVDLSPVGDSGQFVSDSGALAFLTKHAFDFNALVYSGLPPSGIPKPQLVAEALTGVVGWLGELVVQACGTDGKATCRFEGSLTQKACLEFALELFSEQFLKVEFTVVEEDSAIVVSATKKSTFAVQDVKNILEIISQNEVIKGRLFSVVDLRQLTDMFGKSQTPLILHNGLGDLLHVLPIY